jgi:hypothetical protein
MATTSKTKNPTASPTVLPLDMWEFLYRPIKNPDQENEEVPLVYEFSIRDEKILRADPGRVWTKLESNGMSFIASGIHYVNREGYYLTEVSHKNSGDENIEVELWGHDDEVDRILHTFSENYSVCLDESRSQILINDEDNEIVAEGRISESRTASFELEGFQFEILYNARFNKGRIRGVLKDGAYSPYHIL